MASIEVEAGPGTRARNRARWRKHLAAQADSGLSVGVYCRQYGLNPKCFYRWRRIFAQGEAATGATRLPGGAAQPLFAEVRVSGVGLAGSGVEVCLAGGRVVRVAPGFDAATLCRVVSALEGRDAC